MKLCRNMYLATAENPQTFKVIRSKVKVTGPDFRIIYRNRRGPIHRGPTHSRVILYTKYNNTEQRKVLESQRFKSAIVVCRRYYFIHTAVQWPVMTELRSPVMDLSIRTFTFFTWQWIRPVALFLSGVRWSPVTRSSIWWPRWPVVQWQTGLKACTQRLKWNELNCLV